MIEVVAAIICRDDKILVARRKHGKHLAGFWEFPGGKIEGGETSEAGLVREIKEELGIEIHVVAFLAENIHQYTEKTILLKAYNCKYMRGTISLVDHDIVQWVTLAQLKKLQMAPADIPFLSFF